MSWVILHSNTSDSTNFANIATKLQPSCFAYHIVLSKKVTRKADPCPEAEIWLLKVGFEFSILRFFVIVSFHNGLNLDESYATLSVNSVVSCSWNLHKLSVPQNRIPSEILSQFGTSMTFTARAGGCIHKAKNTWGELIVNIRWMQHYGWRFIYVAFGQSNPAVVPIWFTLFCVLRL